MSELASHEVLFQASFFPDHQVLKKLKLLRKGTLEVTMPWGEMILFRGRLPGPQADITFHQYEALDRILAEGDIGLGEGYMMGLWDTDDLPRLMQLIADNRVIFEQHTGAGSDRYLYKSKRGFFAGAPAKGRQHVSARYDLGAEFYKLWLDDTLTYSGAIFNGDPEKTLGEAQLAKYERVFARLRPAKSDHILDIGCGWGGFMQEAAGQGYRITGITPSPSEAKYVTERIAKTGIGHVAEIRHQDYRQIAGQYDHVVSIGMIEQIGEASWPDYMGKIYRSLKSGGRAVIQSAVIEDEFFKEYRLGDDFVREHIFPGSMLPSSLRLQSEALAAGLEIKDIFCFGKDCAITIEKWLQRFDANLPKIRALGYSNEFARKWRFYLAGCSALFRTGRLDVMQFQLNKV